MKLSDAPEFLTLEELQDEIEEYTYRPGWELSVFADPWEGPCLYVKATVENAYQKEPLEIRVRSLIPPIPDAEYFGHWLLWRLIQIENHEAREIRLPNGAVATGHFVETALGLLHQIRPPRYEVRSGNLGDWEIWDKQAGWRIATFHSKDESYANNWVRYLNETEDRGD